MAPPDSAGKEYRIDYFLGRSTRSASPQLFKKVDYPGRRRPEIFALDGERWVKASGLSPRLSGTPEWDPSATRIAESEAEDLMLTTGLTAVQARALLTSKEGQRRWPRRAGARAG